MPPTTADVRVNVTSANPGQFFACCGLLELADRLWLGAEGWFEESQFCLTRTSAASPLSNLIETISGGSIATIEPTDSNADDEGELAWPLLFALGDIRLLLNWWRDHRSGGDALKVWAGSMHAGRIASAMLAAMAEPRYHHANTLNVSAVVPDPDDPRKKKEPFYFDARRGSHALSRDIGFSPDAVGVTVGAYPVVEFLCLVGLQRFRPRPVDELRTRRTFTYFTWTVPLLPEVAALATQGYLPGVGRSGFRFENRFRTGQRKHKAFGAATPLGGKFNG